MNQCLREKILTDARGLIARPTLEVLETEKVYLCLGRRPLATVGCWAAYARDGPCVRSWRKLTFDSLRQMILLEARSRAFLQGGTFLFEEALYFNAPALIAWAVGKNDLLYRSVWLLKGYCAAEWSALLPTNKNQNPAVWNWIAYQKSRALYGQGEE